MQISKSLTKKVDQLATINATIADLKFKADIIKADLMDSGLESIDGQLFRATIVHATITRLDQSKAKSFLTPAQLSNCFVSSDSISVRIYPRT